MKRRKEFCLIAGMLICMIFFGCGAAPRMLQQDNELGTDAQAGALESTYQELMDVIYELILDEDQQTELELATRAVNGILEAGYSRSPDETLEYVGYALWDMNADGMPELIIGGIDEERDGKYFGRDIYAVYTCTQDEIHCICSGWSRNNVGWMGENVFYNMGSGGALYTSVGKYELLPNATQWSAIDLYFTDENGIYRSQTGINDSAHAEALDLSWDEFWALCGELSARVLDFELTPFSNYTGTSPGRKTNEEVTVRWAEEILPAVTEHDEFVAYSGEYATSVAFTAADCVYDFKVLALQLESVDEEGNLYFSTTELYDYGELAADRAFVVELVFEGAIPGYGISYVDVRGNTRLYSVNLSGYDGSLLLQQIVQTQP